MEDTVSTTTRPDGVWHLACSIDQVPLDRGVAAIIDTVPVAVFRLSPIEPDGDEQWFAVDHVDPATAAPVMARGLVGSTGDGAMTVASPLTKDRYDLRTGEALDGSDKKLRTHEIVVADGTVAIRLRT